MADPADLNIYRGDDYAATVIVLNPDGSDADLAGYSAQAQIRPSWADASVTPAAEFQCAIAANEIAIFLTHDQTRVLLSPSYCWDIQVIDPSGWITTILAGRVVMTGEATQVYAATANGSVATLLRRAQ